MNITILSVGKKENLYREAILLYSKRINKPWSLQIETLSPSGHKDPSICRKAETELIIKKLSTLKKDRVVFLDERGVSISTKMMSAMYKKFLDHNVKHMIYIIGGAYGIDTTLLSPHIDETIRISDMTLPHEMVKLILIEQIYRSISILQGSDYHHE